MFQALHVFKDMFANVSFSPSDITDATSLDAMYAQLEESNIWITTDLLAWIGMHALLPFNPVFSMQHSVYLSNPLQALLFHYIIKDVLCYVVDEGIASKLPGDRSDCEDEHAALLERTKIKSEKMTQLIKNYCGRQEISIPEFESFYFQPLEEGDPQVSHEDDDDEDAEDPAFATFDYGEEIEGLGEEELYDEQEEDERNSTPAQGNRRIQEV
jgi:hypothetical protein